MLHQCAITTDGDAQCWGDNISNQSRVPKEYARFQIHSNKSSTNGSWSLLFDWSSKEPFAVFWGTSTKTASATIQKSWLSILRCSLSLPDQHDHDHEHREREENPRLLHTLIPCVPIQPSHPPLGKACAAQPPLTISHYSQRTTRMGPCSTFPTRTSGLRLLAATSPGRISLVGGQYQQATPTLAGSRIRVLPFAGGRGKISR